MAILRIIKLWLRSYFILLLSMAVIFTGCSEKKEKENTSKVKIKLPLNPAAVKKVHRINTSANGDWALPHPSSMSDIYCYALSVSGPEESLKGISCSDADEKKVLNVGLLKGLYPGGSSIEVEVPSGEQRQLSLLAFSAVDLESCEQISGSVAKNRLSPPSILSSVTQDLEPGDAELTMQIDFTQATQIADCEWAKVINTPPVNTTPEDLQINIASVSPQDGNLVGGTQLQIFGSGFDENAEVKIGDLLCDSVQLVSESELTCLTPALAAGLHTVSVSQLDLASELVDGFEAKVHELTIATPASVATLNAQSTSLQVSGACSFANDVSVSPAPFTQAVPCDAGTFNLSFDASLFADGPTTLTLTHLDHEGRAVSELVDVVKDSIAPVLTLDSLIIVNSTNAASYPIAGSCEIGVDINYTADSVTGTESCLDGSYFANIDLSSLADGGISLTVSQTDGAGNISNVPGSTSKDTQGPSVTINQASGQVDPAPGFPINFDVAFSEPIDDSTFTAADITHSGTATGVTWTVTNSGDDINFTVAAIAGDNSASYIPSLAAATVTDAAQNPNAASTSADNSVTRDSNTNPTVSDVGAQAITEDSPLGATAFTIGDAESTLFCNTHVTATSSDQTVIPDSNITIAGGATQSCTVSLNPAADQSGSVTITLTADDGALTGEDTFLVLVSAVDDAPVTSAQAPASFAEDTESVITLNYTDVESDAATACSLANLSSVTETTPCSCTAGTCSVGVTGVADYNGAASFDFSVTANLTSNFSTVSLTIDSVNDTPVISHSCSAAANEDTAFSCNPSKTDPDTGDSFVWRLDAANTCSWAGINPTTGALSGTPDNSDVGACDLKFVVFDGTVDSAVETIAISVTNLAPTLTIADTSVPDNAGMTEIRDDASVQASDEGVGGTYTLDNAGTTATKCSDVSTSLTIDANTGAVSMDPDGVFSGFCNVKVHFDDGNGGGINDEFAVDVQDVTAPSAPTSLTLNTPASSPSNDTTPKIDVNSVAGDTIKLFTDASCLTQVGSATAAGATTSVTTSALSEGTHTIYANATDPSANTSPCSTASVTYEVDTTAPANPTLSLSDGTTSSTTHVRQQIIGINIGNDASAAKWCISETQTTMPASGTSSCTGGAGASNGWFTTEPTTFNTSVGDGVKTVYVWLADLADNVSAGVVSDTITLDATLPANPTVALADPNTSSSTNTNQATVDISITADTDAVGWCVIEQDSAAGAPSPPLYNDACFVGTRPVTVNLGLEGSRRVYVYTKDLAENVSATAVTTDINYSTTGAANPTLALSDGTTSSTTHVRQQTVDINIGNDGSAAKWCVSETQATKPALGTSVCNGGTGASNGWHTAEPTTFNVSAGDGVKTVYVWIADLSNNVNAGVVSDMITLDTTLPANPTVALADPNTASNSNTNQATVDISITADTDAVGWCVIEQDSAAGAPSPPLYNDVCFVGTRPTTVSLGLEGSRKVYVYTKDVAKNISAAAVTADISYATAAPADATLALTDGTTGSSTHVRQQTVDINIGNDGSAAKWCVSETQATKPALGTSICNGGTGASNGWHTTEPTTFNVSAGDGAKTVYVWIADLSNNVNAGVVSDMITLDATLPANPTVALADPNTASSSNTNQATVDLSITADTDAVGWCVIEQDSAVGAPSAPLYNDGCFVGTRPATTILGAVGARRVYVYTKDIADNVSANAATADISYSTTAPANPILALSDPGTSSPTYIRQVAANADITNDGTATRWCLSETQSTKPALGTSTCTGGAGPSNGWFTTEPTTFSVASGDGSKNVYVWVADVFNNVNTGAISDTITLDTVPPGAFNITGATGNTDSIADAFLGSTVNPTANWGAATGAVNYLVSVKDSGASATICAQVSEGTTSHAFGCALTDGTNYTIQVIAEDVAGNQTIASNNDFPFTVDNTAPAMPSINDGGVVYITSTLNPSFTGSTDANFEDYHYTTDGSPPDCTSTAGASSSILASGSTQLRVIACDLAGNQSGENSVTYAAFDSSLIVPFYTNAPQWNDYAAIEHDRTSAACSSPTTGKCFHGGERRVVELAELTSCGDLAITDGLGVYGWECDDTGAFVIFSGHFMGSLSSLVDASAWKTNSVTLTGAEAQNGSVSTAAVAFHTNTVSALPDSSSSVGNLSGVGTVYTYNGLTNSHGYEITADKVSIVSLGGLSFIKRPDGVTTNNCNATTGGGGSPDAHCMVFALGRNYLWLELATDGNDSTLPDRADHGLHLHTVHNSKIVNSFFKTGLVSGLYMSGSSFNDIRDTTVAGFKDGNVGHGVDLVASSDYNYFQKLRLHTNGQGGMKVSNSTENIIADIVAADSDDYGLLLDNSTKNKVFHGRFSSFAGAGTWGSGLSLDSSHDNIILGITATNAYGGVTLNRSDHNILGYVTVTNSTDDAVFLGDIGNAQGYSNDNTLYQVVAANNAAIGIHALYSNNNKYHDMAAVHNDIGFQVDSTSQVETFLGQLIYGNNPTNDCWADSGLTTGTCADANSSSTVQTNTTADLTSSFVGKGVTLAFSSMVGEWINQVGGAFELWGANGGAFPANNNHGACTTGTCVAWNWALDAADTQLKEVLAAPTGSEDFITHQWSDTSTIDFLKHAREINRFESFYLNPINIGNFNGLCESGEPCAIARNIGSYQGHEVLNDSPADIPSSGTVQDVQLFEHSEQLILNSLFDVETDGTTNGSAAVNKRVGESGGTDRRYAVSFDSGSLPAGATIVDARIQFTAQAGLGGNIDLVIDGNDVDNGSINGLAAAALFTPTTMTSAGQRVFWSMPNWNSGDVQQSPDVATIVQTIIDRGGWASGNKIEFFIHSTTGSSTERTLRSHNHATPKDRPKLIINYTP